MHEQVTTATKREAAKIAQQKIKKARAAKDAGAQERRGACSTSQGEGSNKKKKSKTLAAGGAKTGEGKKVSKRLKRSDGKHVELDLSDCAEEDEEAPPVDEEDASSDE